MHKYAIIAAGGAGTRMGGNTRKQFLLLKNKPILYYTINRFLSAFPDIEIIVVLPSDDLETGKIIVQKYFDSAGIKITKGGDTRFHSVKNGLSLVEKNSLVFIHDAVRCLVSENLIKSCYETAVRTGTAVPAIPVKDSLRFIDGDDSTVLNREKVVLIQTPQTFKSEIILPAFQVDYTEQFTDEATVVEASGVKITLVKGEENNLKITKPIDLFLAEKLINVFSDD